MGANHDGKVTICTALDNSGIEKDMGEVAGEFGGLNKVLGNTKKAITGALSKPVSESCAKIKKDISAAEKQIEQYQKQIQKSEAAKLPLLDQANQLGAELDAAKAKLAELQALQQSAGNILASAGEQELSGPNLEAYLNAYEQKPQLDLDVSQQQAQVDALQKKWDEANNKIEAYNAKIDQANREITQQKKNVEDLAKEYKVAEKETKKLGKNVANANGGVGAMEKSVRSFSSRLKSIAMGALLFNGISAGLREFTSYLGNTLKTNEKFVAELSKLKGALLTAFQPIYNAIAPALIYLIRILTSATLVIAEFFAMITGTNISSSAAAADNLYQEADAIDKVEEAAKKAGKTVAGFDELNVLQDKSQSTGSTGSPTGNSGTIAPDFSTDMVDGVREAMEAILVLVGLIGAGILAWKLIDAYTAGTSLLGVFKGAAAQLLIIAGAILLVTGYCDAWVNGVDWGNLLAVLGGVAAVLGGLYIKFGSLGAGIGAVAAGVAMVVLGIKDFVKNGATMQNAILIIGGAIAVAIGLATAGLSTVTAAIVGVVTAVGAFVAAIVLEEPAIMTVEQAQKNLTAAKEAAAEAENGYINAVDAAENALNRLKEAEESAGVTGAELYSQVQSGTLDYANMTSAQREVYKAYLDNEQKQKDLEESTRAFNEAKKAETIASYENQLALAKESGNYDEFKNSVVAAFEAGELSASEARDLIGKSMSEMSDDTQKTFMEDLPGDIKTGLDPSQYETTRKKMGDWFKSVGKGFIENIWQPVKQFWKDHIAQVFTGKFWVNLAKDCGNGLISGFEAAINGIISLFETMINWVVGGLNKISFDVPDWVPGIGGKKFGFNIKKVKFDRVSIPRLATGAVIPPNKEFMAVLGDQKHGTNIEAPLATIQEAVALVMQDQTSAIMAGFEASVGIQREILEAVLGIQIGDDVIGTAVERYNRKRAIMRGSTV